MDLNVSHDALIAIIIGHLLAVVATLARVSHHRKFFLWADDYLGSATAVANTILLVKVFIFAVNHRVVDQYRVEWALAFFIIWFSRATLLMAPTRLRKKQKFIVIRASVAAATICLIGIAYALLSYFLCASPKECELSVCVCNPPRSLLISAFIAEIFVDAGLLCYNWVIFFFYIGQPASEKMPMWQRIAVAGFCSNLIILMASGMCLAVYLTRGQSHPIVFIYLVNITAIFSALASNISIAIGVISPRKLPLPDNGQDNISLQPMHMVDH